MSNEQEASLMPESELGHPQAVEVFMGIYLTCEMFEDIRAVIRTKDRVYDTETFSSRLINHWENEGLISDLRPSGKGWRKYSLIDRFWLEAILELRKFGFPLERIKKLKNNLVRDETNSVSSMPYLEVYFVLASMFKEPCYLLVYPDGEAALAIFDEYNLSGDLCNTANFISINLNRLIERIFPDKDLAVKFKSTLSLSSEEMELVQLVRKGNFESITVKRKNGKIDFIEATETLSADARLTEILKEQDYQNIEIKTAGGKTVCIKRTIKKKV